jgi:hypothetical protein
MFNDRRYWVVLMLQASGFSYRHGIISGTGISDIDMIPHWLTRRASHATPTREGRLDTASIMDQKHLFIHICAGVTHS